MSLAEKGLAARVRRCMEELALENETRPQEERISARLLHELTKAVPLAAQLERWTDKRRFVELWQTGCGISRLAELKTQPLSAAQQKVIDELERWAAKFAETAKFE